MAPGRGITIYPGANIDFSALAGASRKVSPLLPRDYTDSTTGIWTIVGFVILGLAVVGLVFCVIVLGFIWKNQRQRRKRQRQMDATAPPKHEYTQLGEMDTTDSGIQELPGGATVGAQNAELPSDDSEIQRVQQLDGFVAPPRRGTQPAELPAR